MSVRPSQRHVQDLATGSIVIRIRWFGIAMGYALVLSRSGLRDPWAVAAILGLGAGFAAMDTIAHRLGDVFLRKWPLFVSLMEAIFIALLCYHDTGFTSPFRWYYLLSLVCCSIRYDPRVAWLTFGFHAGSYLALMAVLSPAAAEATRSEVPLTLVIMGWVTWASSSLSRLLRQAGERLERTNAELQINREELEARVAERTDALRAAQARELQKEKLSAFGLLAAGIAHEVGNPLAALGNLVQMLQRRNDDPYSQEKLELARNQLERIRRTIRELVDFSRPAAPDAGPVRIGEVVEDALGILKYYHATKGRHLLTSIPSDLPTVWAVRDHLTQVLFNLLVNAIDATPRGGTIRVDARVEIDRVLVEVADDGEGIPFERQGRVFEPYQTTKPSGTGLGLFVSRQIVEELGGRLGFRSSPGAGAVFVVDLPARREIGLESPRRALESPRSLVESAR